MRYRIVLLSIILILALGALVFALPTILPFRDSPTNPPARAMQLYLTGHDLSIPDLGRIRIPSDWSIRRSSPQEIALVPSLPPGSTLRYEASIALFVKSANESLDRVVDRNRTILAPQLIASTSTRETVRAHLAFDVDMVTADTTDRHTLAQYIALNDTTYLLISVTAFETRASADELHSLMTRLIPY